MSEEQIMIAAVVELIYDLHDSQNTAKALDLIKKLETRCEQFSTGEEKAYCRRCIGACLVDIGSSVKDAEMIQRGTQYFIEWYEEFVQGKYAISPELYNIANGYFDQWKLNKKHHLDNGEDAIEHRNSRKFYRLAIENFSQDKQLAASQKCNISINYGNTLDSIWRSVEALDAYDEALQICPEMSEALGNKAITLIHLAPLMQGHTHRFYLEAQHLLEMAIPTAPYPEMRVDFEAHAKGLDESLKKHGKTLPEDVDLITPTNDFHKFLCAFCAKHRLFLNPVTLLGKEEKEFYGDPMFISEMHASLNEKDKFDRYVTFLNEIKQDYILGRTQLVQSQYRSDDFDVVDKGVALYYPLDYSLNSIYIQLLKAALKQAVSVLDKVAFFIYDYCKLTTPSPTDVTFRKLLAGTPRMRKDLRTFNNRYLFALSTLANDLVKNGDWEKVFEHRNALTHRFLVIHSQDRHDKTNSDIPREREDIFTKEVISVMKVARAAVMYLILFVEIEERKAADENPGAKGLIYGVPIDDNLRHKPDL